METQEVFLFVHAELIFHFYYLLLAIVSDYVGIEIQLQTEQCIIYDKQP